MRNKKKIRSRGFIGLFTAIIVIFIAKSNEKPSDSFIWEVKIENSTFYLAGSSHAASKDNYPLPKIYTKSYKKADKVIFELEENYDELQKKIFAYIDKDKLPENINLKDSLSPESLEKLKLFFTDDELNKYLKYEAWVLNMKIAGYFPKLIGYDPKLSIDKYFRDLAEKDKLDVIGLEDVSSQLKLVEFHVPLKLQIKILEKSLSEINNIALNQKPIIDAYFNNDIDTFRKEFLKSHNSDDPKYKKLFSDRNKKWVEEFVSLAKDKPGKYFVLVGSGHYFGPDNILELLKSKGYTVEKI